MRILVTSAAGGRKSKVSTGEIFSFDRRTLCGCDVIWDMALRAGESGVLALERISGLAVIKFLRLPFDEREIQTVVLRVTASAFFTRTTLEVVRRMQATLGNYSRGDFVMAVQAAKCGFATAELVAGGALSGGVETPMRSR